MCADMVPGCDATVRAPKLADVTQQASAHLVAAHGKAEGAALTAQIEALTRNTGLLATLLRR